MSRSDKRGNLARRRRLGEFAPKRKKAPEGFPGEGKLFGEEGKRKINSFLDIDQATSAHVDRHRHSNIGLAVDRLDHDTDICPVVNVVALDVRAIAISDLLDQIIQLGSFFIF